MQFPQFLQPVAFALGPFEIRWYALAYLGGVLLGCAYAMTLLGRHGLWKDNRPPFPTPAIWDFAFWAVLGIVLGGRVGYVLFYNLPYYLENPGAIVALWDGGMSFHGGLVGIMLAMALFTRFHKGNILSGFDLLAAISAIGLFLGRMANFVNSELWGAPTTLPWGFIFPNDPEGVPRHPTQLYEALLEGVLLFVLINVLIRSTRALKHPGLIAGIFGIGYAVSRIFVEFFRLPDIQIGYLYGGWLTMGMLLSVPIIVAGIGLIVYALRPSRGA